MSDLHPTLTETDRAPPPDSRARRGFLVRATWVATIYAGFAALWIYFSDQALAALFQDPQSLTRWSVFKGLAFVAITSILLLILMQRAFGATESALSALQQSEHRLQASRAELAAVIESALDAIVGIDIDGRIRLLNRAAEVLFACSRDQLRGQPVAQVLPEGLPGLAERCELPALASDGRRFPVEASLSQVGEGPAVLRIAILRDIGARRAQEHEIERLNRLYAAQDSIGRACAHTHDRASLFDRVCRGLVDPGGLSLAWIAWAERRSRRLCAEAAHGRDAETAAGIALPLEEDGALAGPAITAFRTGKPSICNDLLDEPNISALRRRAIEVGFRACAAFPIRHKGQVAGTLSVFADSADVFHDKEMALLAGTALDISAALDRFVAEDEKRQAEAEAQRERLFSQTMVESMPGLLYLYDARGQFLRWNRQMERTSGYGPVEIAGMQPLDFFEPAEHDRVATRIAEVFAQGESAVEAPLRHKDGSTTPFLWTGRRVDFEGNPCLVGVGIDISERKRAEAALRELNETLEHKVDERTRELAAAVLRAESADRLKSAFLATMSHELRTPLNSIIGFTGIVLQGLAGPLNDEQAKQLGMVRASARHLLDLINDVLDLSKIEAGQLQLRRESFDLAESIARCLASLEPQARAKGLALRSEVSADIGRVESDRRRVEQILLNLLNNAVKFTLRGEVRIEAERVPHWQAGPDGPPCEAVRVRVRDTGIGIRAEDLSALFRPFSQIDTGLARQHEGTGLGLAICRRLLELLGGRIQARSEWQKGSEFEFVLPVVSPSAAPASTPPALPNGATPIS